MSTSLATITTQFNTKLCHHFEIPEFLKDFDINWLDHTNSTVSYCEDDLNVEQIDIQNQAYIQFFYWILSKDSNKRSCIERKYINIFFNSCDFLNFYKEIQGKKYFKQFYKHFNVELYRKGDVLISSCNSQNDFIVNLYGVVKKKVICEKKSELVSSQIQHPQLNGDFSNLQIKKIQSRRSIFIKKDIEIPNESQINLSSKKSMVGNIQVLAANNLIPDVNHISKDSDDIIFEEKSTKIQELTNSFRDITTKKKTLKNPYIVSPNILNTTKKVTKRKPQKDYTVVCKTDCIVVRMSHIDYHSNYETINERIVQEKIQQIENFPICEKLQRFVLRDILSKAVVKNTIFRSRLYDFGEHADSIFFVQNGEFEQEMDLACYEQKNSGIFKNKSKRIDILSPLGQSKNVSKKNLIKLIISPNETFGDFEIGMDFLTRKTKVTCISNKAELLQIHIKNLHPLLLKNIQELHQKRYEHYHDSFVKNVETNKKIELERKIFSKICKTENPLQNSNEKNSVLSHRDNNGDLIKYLKVVQEGNTNLGKKIEKKLSSKNFLMDTTLKTQDILQNSKDSNKFVNSIDKLKAYKNLPVTGNSFTDMNRLTPNKNKESSTEENQRHDGINRALIDLVGLKNFDRNKLKKTLQTENFNLSTHFSMIQPLSPQQNDPRITSLTEQDENQLFFTKDNLPSYPKKSSYTFSPTKIRKQRHIDTIIFNTAKNTNVGISNEDILNQSLQASNHKKKAVGVWLNNLLESKPANIDEVQYISEKQLKMVLSDKKNTSISSKKRNKKILKGNLNSSREILHLDNSDKKLTRNLSKSLEPIIEQPQIEWKKVNITKSITNLRGTNGSLNQIRDCKIKKEKLKHIFSEFAHLKDEFNIKNAVPDSSNVEDSKYTVKDLDNCEYFKSFNESIDKICAKSQKYESSELKDVAKKEKLFDVCKKQTIGNNRTHIFFKSKKKLNQNINSSNDMNIVSPNKLARDSKILLPCGDNLNTSFTSNNMFESKILQNSLGKFGEESGSILSGYSKMYSKVNTLNYYTRKDRSLSPRQSDGVSKEKLKGMDDIQLGMKFADYEKPENGFSKSIYEKKQPMPEKLSSSIDNIIYKKNVKNWVPVFTKKNESNLRLVSLDKTKNNALYKKMLEKRNISEQVSSNNNSNVINDKNLPKKIEKNITEKRANLRCRGIQRNMFIPKYQKNSSNQLQNKSSIIQNMDVCKAIDSPMTFTNNECFQKANKKLMLKYNQYNNSEQSRSKENFQSHFEENNGNNFVLFDINTETSKTFESKKNEIQDNKHSKEKTNAEFKQKKCSEIIFLT